MSNYNKLESDVIWIKNIFPEAVNFIKKEIISEFLEDLKLYHPIGIWKYNRKELIEKWEEKLK